MLPATMRAAPLLAATLIAAIAGGGVLAQKPPPATPGQAPAPAPQARNFPPLPTTKPPPLPEAPGPAAAGKPGAPAPAPSGRVLSTGTGFVVAPGRALTNHHVIEGCRAVSARNAANADLPARVLASDRQRDLALLELPETAGPPLAFRRDPNIRRGEGVVTYGFPLAGLLASGPTLTTGEISALAGLRNNQLHYQISAPVQPGNSGGPLLDMAGLVVGVIVSKLNAQRIAEQTGDIPQNVNFAVKGGEALAFLRSHGVAPRLAEGSPRSAAEVGELAHPSVLFLRCLG